MALHFMADLPIVMTFSVRALAGVTATAHIRAGDFPVRRADSEDTFNAREVIENLGPKLIHPEIKA